MISLASFGFAIASAYGQSVEIVSPNKAYTFAYGDAITHQIERDHFTNEMIARVTFSNYPYAGDREPRRDETFDFVFPGLRFDAARNVKTARFHFTRRTTGLKAGVNERIPRLHPLPFEKGEAKSSRSGR